MMHDWQYIGVCKKLMYGKDNLCPMQCDSEESKMYYLWYGDTAISLKRSVLLFTLQKQLQSHNTCPGITLIFAHILKKGFEQDWENGIED